MYKAVQLEHLLSKTMKNEREKNQRQPGERVHTMKNEPVRCSRDRLHIFHLHTFFLFPSIPPVQFLFCSFSLARVLSLSFLSLSLSRLLANKKSLKERKKHSTDTCYMYFYYECLNCENMCVYCTIVDQMYFMLKYLLHSKVFCWFDMLVWHKAYIGTRINNTYA